ncbi:hypothetical protein PsorP6_003627 [Peronosclerospora sorghi]|uniref:Uncharacterized protein n=1 Tax=Peronosclerospora sorghi TaxID=230839 RepID=A0ACC0VN72_9STRA|nr:hypothetical protein PsorP6_003627 [Peronosclerospora sorghi]
MGMRQTGRDHLQQQFPLGSDQRTQDQERMHTFRLYHGLDQKANKGESKRAGQPVHAHKIRIRQTFFVARKTASDTQQQLAPLGAIQHGRKQGTDQLIRLGVNIFTTRCGNARETREDPIRRRLGIAFKLRNRFSERDNRTVATSVVLGASFGHGGIPKQVQNVTVDAWISERACDIVQESHLERNSFRCVGMMKPGEERLDQCISDRRASSFRTTSFNRAFLESHQSDLISHTHVQAQCSVKVIRRSVTQVGT